MSRLELPDDFRDVLVALHADVDGRGVVVIGREALLRNNRAAGRHKDLDDVEWLEQAASR